MVSFAPEGQRTLSEKEPSHMKLLKGGTIMTALWVAIPVGMLIVLLAVAIPYWLTQRRMREHHDLSEAYEYLAAIGKTPAEAATGQPGRLQWQRAAGEKP